MKPTHAALFVCASAVLLLLVSFAVVAQGAPASSPPGVMRPSGATGTRGIVIGPSDTLTTPKRVRGKMTVTINAGPTQKLASVDVQVDGKSIGVASKQPFSVDFDTTGFKDGDHILKAIGRDESGKEVWTCSAKAIVLNSRQSMAAAMPPSARPSGLPESRGAATPDKVRKPEKTASAPGTTAKKSGKEKAKAGKVPADLSLDRTYTSDDYGFAVQYPGKWTFNDKTTTMSPKTEGGFWLAFGEYPLEKSRLVVNIRRTKLEPGTDSKKFAQYNSYVRKWETRTVWGCPAFATTGRGNAGELIHRLIVLKDGYAWLMNCEDATKKPSEESGALFDSMVNSVQPKSIEKPAVETAKPAKGDAAPEHARPAPPPVVHPSDDAPPPPPPMGASVDSGTGSDIPPGEAPMPPPPAPETSDESTDEPGL